MLLNPSKKSSFEPVESDQFQIGPRRSAATLWNNTAIHSRSRICRTSFSTVLMRRVELDTKKNRFLKLRCLVPSDSICESRKTYRLNFCINNKHQFTMQRIRQEQARIERSPRNQFQNLGASLPLEIGHL